MFFQFVALQLSWKVEELEMYIRMDRHRVGLKPSSTGEAKPRPFDGLERLREDTLLSELHPSFATSNGNMVRSSIETNLLRLRIILFCLQHVALIHCSCL